MRIFILSALLLLQYYHAEAGWFYEHKFIGDSAFKKFIYINHLESFLSNTLHFPVFGLKATIPFSRNCSVIDYYRGMYAIPASNQVYSYGDLSGLAGDHTVDFIQLYQALIGDTDALAHLAPGPKYAELFAEAQSALKSHRKAIDKGKRQGNFFSFPYVFIAGEDKSHFQRPPESFSQMLESLDSNIIQAVFQFNITADPTSARQKEKWVCCKKHSASIQCTRRAIDKRLLRLNNASKYGLLHLWAEEEVKAAALSYSQQDTPKFAAYFKAALVINAFADHFLQDAFAAGHMAVKRNHCGLDNKGVHDFYCRVGINVQNTDTIYDPVTGKLLPEKWTTYGDNHYDSATFKHAIDANVQSLQEVWDWFNKHLQACNKSAYLATRLEDMAANKQLQNHWPDSILTNFQAYKFMPTPLNVQSYDDSIKLKRGSKSGFYYDAGFSTAFLPYSAFRNFMVNASFGFLGYNLVAPGKSLPADFRKGIESIFWFGPSVNYNFFRHNDVNENRIYLAANTTFIEFIAFDAGLGASIIADTGLPYEYLAAGGEFKSLKCRLAPSLKYFVEFEEHHRPSMGLRLALRIY